MQHYTNNHILCYALFEVDKISKEIIDQNFWKMERKNQGKKKRGKTARSNLIEPTKREKGKRKKKKKWTSLKFKVAFFYR